MAKRPQRLLVSVRGPIEAVEACKGGAGIADVEYPASALGTSYPLNIHAVKKSVAEAGFRGVQVSTNIGETQAVRAASCQAALGVAAAGADIIKFGLAEQSLSAAVYLARNIVRTVRALAPRNKELLPAVFVDAELQRFLSPFEEGPELLKACKADGVLIDTFNKLIGKGLLDYCSIDDIGRLVSIVHRSRKQLWIAGSISIEQLPDLWKTGVDVICVRGAACTPAKGTGRFGAVEAAVVENLVATIPRR